MEGSAHLQQAGFRFDELPLELGHLPPELVAGGRRAPISTSAPRRALAALVESAALAWLPWRSCSARSVGVVRTLPGALGRPGSATPTSNSSVTFRSPCSSSSWYFVLPVAVAGAGSGLWLKQMPDVPSLDRGRRRLGLGMSARVAEQVRAGRRRCRAGNGWREMALGLTTAQTYRYVLLPMAYRIILPPLTSEFLNTIKNTSVALTIGLLELTARARAIQEFSFPGVRGVHRGDSWSPSRAQRRRRDADADAGAEGLRQFFFTQVNAPAITSFGLIKVMTDSRGVRPASTSTDRASSATSSSTGMSFYAHPHRFWRRLGGDRPRHAAGADAARRGCSLLPRLCRALRQPDALASAGAGDLLVLLPRALSR